MQRLSLVLISLFILGALLFVPTASHAGRILFTNNSKENCYRFKVISYFLNLDIPYYHLSKPQTKYIFDDVLGGIERITYASSPVAKCNDAGKDGYYVAWQLKGESSPTRSFRITVRETEEVDTEITRN